MKEEGKVVEMPQTSGEKIPTQEHLKRMRKDTAIQLADYKKRLKESVELKRLQVEELELNIKFYHVSKEYQSIELLMMEEQAKEAAERQEKMRKQQPASKLDIHFVGEARTEEEIEEAKKI